MGQGDTVTLDAVGPQSVTFREMVDMIRVAVGSRALAVTVPGPVLLGLSSVLSAALRDTLLTREEYQAMADGLADSAAPATGEAVFTDWVAAHGAELGRAYVNELDRHFRPARPLRTA